MIKFYGDDFELNLTDIKITFIEENNIFHNYFLKNHSFPFSFKLDDETSKKLGFIDDYQSKINNAKHYGKLQFDDSFEDAFLEITAISKSVVSGQLSYGKSTIPVFEIPLPNLPFKTITVNSIVSHAKEVTTKKWPEVGYNFPMIIDLNHKTNTDYEKFEGIKNRTITGNFVINTSIIEDSKTVPLNKNIITPCIYLMEILKTGFDSANMVMIGDFINDKVNEKIILDSDVSIEKFNSDKVNVFSNTFNLKKFLPDITFGSFLNIIKNWLNLDIKFRKNIVTINYVENRFRTINFPDNSHLEVESLKIAANKKKFYRLRYTDLEELTISKKGIDNSAMVDSDIKTLDMGLSVLKRNTHNSITSSKINEFDGELRFMLYNGLQNGKNITVNNVFGKSFSLEKVYNRSWKNWLLFRLNSKTFTDNYKIDSDMLDIEQGQYKYLNKQIIKKIKKRRLGELWSFSVESESLI